MVFKELLHNLALIMVMGVLYSFLYRRLEFSSLKFKAASGVLFGTIAVLGMKLSFTLTHGIIFDGRSVILAIAGLFGGFWSALIASVMSAAYRIWIGGGGTVMGVLVIISSAGLGVGYNLLRMKSRHLTRLPYLYLFGILVHACMIILMSTLPGGYRLIVFEKIAVPVIALFPIATVIICTLLIDQERRIGDEKALRENETRLRTILGNMPVMLVSFDAECRVVSWNAECEKVTGYTADEMVGNPDTSHILSPRDLIYAPTAERPPLSDNAYTKTERDILCKDGSTRTILWSTMPGAFTIPGWHTWAVGIDISERKTNEIRIESSLKEKEILLMEVHHRVKNNMQLISSLLSLQASKINEEASRRLFSESVDRIRAIALVHEMLYMSDDFSQIDFRYYISKLASALSGIYNTTGRNISVINRVEEIYLPLDVAVPCAMILNETITNSMKHAFPEDTGGTIAIRFRKDDNGRCTMEIADNGVGMRDMNNPDTASTLGMQLVVSLTRQLNGSLKILSEQGAIVIIDFTCR